MAPTSASVDSPAWRHIKMLSSLVSADGNTPLIKGCFDHMEPLNPARLSSRRGVKNQHENSGEKNLGVGSLHSDDPFTMVEKARYGTSFNLDGIWGGNMYPGTAGAILPTRSVSKHNLRYVPSMDGMDLYEKDPGAAGRNGYKDVEMKLSATSHGPNVLQHRYRHAVDPCMSSLVVLFANLQTFLDLGRLLAVLSVLQWSGRAKGRLCVFADCRRRRRGWRQSSRLE